MIGAIISAAAGLGFAGYGVAQQRKAARKQEQELAKQRAANEAWYKRSYYQDYMNTVEAQNAVKRYRDAWDEQARQARARQAITGGTPEQAQAVAEAGGEAMGDMMGNLAAQGQQNRQAIDAQKLAVDTNVSQQQMAIEEQRQQAAANLVNNGINVATSALRSMDPKAKVASSLPSMPGQADMSHVKPGVLPDKIKPLNLY